MSGHNKWASIKHKKAAEDAKRGKLFTKLIKELTMAAREGGGSSETNPRLRTAIAKAKAGNMPQENIDRAIKKGTGELPGVVYEEVVYEGYGHGGVAILVEVVTDNKNRSSAELRHIFSKRGGNMAGAGSVAWQFEKKGYITIDKTGIEEDALMTVALEAGAEDFKSEDADYEIFTDLASFETVKQAVRTAGFTPKEEELTMIPKSFVKLEGDQAKALLGLINAFEENDDVQNVYANFDIPDEILESL